MKGGRRIRVKSEALRKIRTNLRRLFYTALGSQSYRPMDLAELQSPLGNQSPKVHFSICSCYRCGSFEKDAVFFSREIYIPMYYPPVDVKTWLPETYWLCPECYKREMDDFNYYKDKKYYFFHKDGTFASLEELGIEKLEDY
ncbi:hypothetical protein LCGC14_0690840 [marine sediment metagenome]|uniref:Uncharacterized protein n=1 Tax=marine sediment metagenome TaxID=412755 RepID=A0A0F9QQE3_9ZZZZ